MMTPPSHDDETISRRGILSRAAIIAGGAAVAGGLLVAAPASAKVSPKGVSYQSTPKGGQRCDGCKFWQPPAACKLVSGAISPAGWCTLFAKP